MADRIKHSGVIDTIEEGCVKVRILQTSACASCKVAGYCNASEKKEKIIDVYDVSGISKMHVGDSVTVTASKQVAAKALMLGFGIPFLILVSVLSITVLLTSSETIGALASIAALVPYSAVLYLLRDKIRAVLVFSIESINI